MSWAWLIVGLAYIVGMIPSAALIGGLAGVDPSAEGSGNPGASNVYRLAGRRFGFFVLAADVAKGALPVAIGLGIDGRPLAFGCWVAAVLGHIFPAVRKFRGGKGVATTGGGVFVLFPLIGVGLLLVFLAVFQLAKTASIASLTLAVLLPVLVALSGRPTWEGVVAVVLAVLVLIRHQSNIRRILAGNEGHIAG